MECPILIGFLVAFLITCLACIITGISAAKLKSWGLGFLCFAFLCFVVAMETIITKIAGKTFGIEVSPLLPSLTREHLVFLILVPVSLISGIFAAKLRSLGLWLLCFAFSLITILMIIAVVMGITIK